MTKCYDIARTPDGSVGVVLVTRLGWRKTSHEFTSDSWPDTPIGIAKASARAAELNETLVAEHRRSA
jgi:hypothetical protein